MPYPATRRGSIVSSPPLSSEHFPAEVDSAGTRPFRDPAKLASRLRQGAEVAPGAGLPADAADKKPRRRAGYVASWESGQRRAAQDARTSS
jgi:hypothetical protein